MLSFRDLSRTLQSLQIEKRQPVLLHASMSAFGQVNGGVETVVGALLSLYDIVLAPAFTFKTMIIPESGPDENAIQYGSGRDRNKMAEFFQADMPADRLMGVIAETIRCRPNAGRSTHPILSFTGINADSILSLQTLENPLGPVQGIYDQNGWVLLMGVDHTVNTSLHYAERLAGRRQFVRWALTGKGVVQCPGFPGCSNGFQAVHPYLEAFSRSVQSGSAVIQAVPMPALIDTTVNLIRQIPEFLLCSREDCERCASARMQAGRSRERGSVFFPAQVGE